MGLPAGRLELSVSTTVERFVDPRTGRGTTEVGRRTVDVDADRLDLLLDEGNVDP